MRYQCCLAASSEFSTGNHLCTILLSCVLDDFDMFDYAPTFFLHTPMRGMYTCQGDCCPVAHNAVIKIAALHMANGH